MVFDNTVEQALDPDYQLRRVSSASMTQFANALAPEKFPTVTATVLLMIDANPDETQAKA